MLKGKSLFGNKKTFWHIGHALYFASQDDTQEVWYILPQNEQLITLCLLGSTILWHIVHWTFLMSAVFSFFNFTPQKQQKFLEFLLRLGSLFPQ